MSVKVNLAWDDPGQCFFEKDVDGKVHKWLVAGLWDAAKDLPEQEMPMTGLNIAHTWPNITSMLSFVGHMKLVMEANLDHPIIMDQFGEVMDGRHRIAKALFKGNDTIKFVRFEKTPGPDKVVDREVE